MFALSCLVAYLNVFWGLDALRNTLYLRRAVPRTSPVGPIILCAFSCVVSGWVLRCINAHSTIYHCRKKQLVGITAVVMVALGGVVLVSPSYFPYIDPLFAFVIHAISLLKYAAPMLHSNGKIMLQTTPADVRVFLDRGLREASSLDGVIECYNEHFWALDATSYVGSLHVRVRTESDQHLILLQVTKIFAPYIEHLTVQIEKDSRPSVYSNLLKVPSRASATANQSSSWQPIIGIENNSNTDIFSSESLKAFMH